MLSLLNFSGENVVVTGAAAGIGRSCCQLLGELGARVIAVDLDPGLKAIVAPETGEFGDDACAFMADVSQEDAVRELRHAVQSSCSEVSAVINCAGTNAFAPIQEFELSAWNDLLRSDLTSTFLMTKEFLPIVKRPGGSLVTIASTYAFVGAANMAAYCAAKAGVVSFTRQVAVEMASEGIRANSVCPGPVLTPRRQRYFDEGKRDRSKAEGRTLLGRMARPEEVACVAVFLASRASSYMTGSSVTVDGGQLAFTGQSEHEGGREDSTPSVSGADV